MDAGASSLRGARETSRIVERVQPTAAAIDVGSLVPCRSEQAFRSLRIDDLDRGASGLPIFRSQSIGIENLVRVRGLDPTGLAGLAIDLASLDELQREIGKSPRPLEQPLAALRSERARQFCPLRFEAWNDLAAITPRRAPARLYGLQEHGVAPQFREM